MSSVKEVRVLNNPDRPLAIKMLNGVGRGLNSVGIQPIALDKDKLMAAAIKKAGCDDFGDLSFIEGLERALHSMETEADLNLLGRVMAKGTLVNHLANRLQLIQWRKGHPEVAEQEIRQPLFINGLPRTGTTILHALLDVDPANRSPLSWEVEFPVPPATPETWETDSRIAKYQKSMDNFFKMSPDFAAVHPMGATMPQECVMIFGIEMMSVAMHTTFNIPSYVDWVDEQPFDRVYQSHKKFLQHLQSGGVKRERWLLKSPCHLHLVDPLLEAYPDANVIHLHRDPVQVCVSLASLMAMLRSLGSDSVNLHYVGQQQLQWWSKLLGVAVEQRKRHADKPNQFFDQNMSDTVADPIGSVERIYDHFGYELSTKIKTDMEKFMKDNARDKHGSHTYSAADFGIDLEKDRRLFAEYCDYFGV